MNLEPRERSGLKVEEPVIEKLSVEEHTWKRSKTENRNVSVFE